MLTRTRCPVASSTVNTFVAFSGLAALTNGTRLPPGVGAAAAAAGVTCCPAAGLAPAGKPATCCPGAAGAAWPSSPTMTTASNSFEPGFFWMKRVSEPSFSLRALICLVPLAFSPGGINPGTASSFPVWVFLWMNTSSPLAVRALTGAPGLKGSACALLLAACPAAVVALIRAILSRACRFSRASRRGRAASVAIDSAPPANKLPRNWRLRPRLGPVCPAASARSTGTAIRVNALIADCFLPPGVGAAVPNTPPAPGEGCPLKVPCPVCGFGKPIVPPAPPNSGFIPNCFRKKLRSAGGIPAAPPCCSKPPLLIGKVRLPLGIHRPHPKTPLCRE